MYFNNNNTLFKYRMDEREELVKRSELFTPSLFRPTPFQCGPVQPPCRATTGVQISGWPGSLPFQSDYAMASSQLPTLFASSLNFNMRSPSHQTEMSDSLSPPPSASTSTGSSMSVFWPSTTLSPPPQVVPQSDKSSSNPTTPRPIRKTANFYQAEKTESNGRRPKSDTEFNSSLNEWRICPKPSEPIKKSNERQECADMMTNKPTQQQVKQSHSSKKQTGQNTPKKSNKKNQSESWGKSQGRKGQGDRLPIRSKDIDLEGYLSEYFSNPANLERLRGPSKPNDSVPSAKFHCNFCENNGESQKVYQSHPLKDSLGKVVCPVLRLYTCPKCGESGDYAHTNKYCPETQRRQKERKISKCFGNDKPKNKN